MSKYNLRANAETCRTEFGSLLNTSTEIGLLNETADGTYGVHWIEDQFARFRVWAGNIGAFAEGHASLDYRLRDSPQTQSFMSDFLVSLADFIHRGEYLYNP